LTSEFNPRKYKDQYRENLQSIIDAKVKGKSVQLAEAEEPRPTAVIDLVERLQASLKRSGTAPAAGRKKSKGKTTKRSATKTAKRAHHTKKRA
jgi:DNA end-binding protein Ku